MNFGGFTVVVIDEATKAAFPAVAVSNLMRFEESVDVGELRLMDVVVAGVLFVETIEGDGLKHTCLNSVELVEVVVEVVVSFDEGGMACELVVVVVVVVVVVADVLVGTPATAADKSAGGC